MTTQLSDRSGADALSTALEPVRLALLADAQAEAAAIVDQAKVEAAGVVARAHGDVDTAVGQARRRAEDVGAAHAAMTLTRARREAHATVLQAREALRRELVRRVVIAVEAMRGDQRYPALLARLEALARSQLGTAALIEYPPEGGIVAVDGPRRVDYRLAALAERELDALADEVAALWG